VVRGGGRTAPLFTVGEAIWIEKVKRKKGKKGGEERLKIVRERGRRIGIESEGERKREVT
jgi:hypothetical protein